MQARGRHAASMMSSHHALMASTGGCGAYGVGFYGPKLVGPEIKPITRIMGLCLERGSRLGCGLLWLMGGDRSGPLGAPNGPPLTE